MAMTLLALPSEVRLQILGLALDTSTTLHIQPCTTTAHYCKDQHAQPTHIALLSTCRTLYHDVRYLTSNLERVFVFCSTLCADRVLKRTRIERLEVRTTGLWAMQTEMLSGVSRLTAAKGMRWKMGGSRFADGLYVLNFELEDDEKKSEDGAHRGVCAVQ